VLAFLSQAHIEPDLTVEMFLMDGSVPGFGALELVEPPGPRTAHSASVVFSADFTPCVSFSSCGSQARQSRVRARIQ